MKNPIFSTLYKIVPDINPTIAAITIAVMPSDYLAYESIKKDEIVNTIKNAAIKPTVNNVILNNLYPRKQFKNPKAIIIGIIIYL